MSSSVVAESSGSQKTENTVIIFVNNDGSLSVDEQTLQKLLVSNQQKAAVSLVRVGDTEAGKDEAQSCEEVNKEEPTADNSETDPQQPEVNLTVEGFFPQSNTEVAIPADPVVVGTDNLVDPFLEMDPEQLERLETALQSEQAKQILGEGVTAMLDMLTSEDDQTTTLKNSIKMDHCYTTSCGRGSPSKPGEEEEAAAEKSDSDDRDDEDDEEETESEEELDSEEEAKRKRGARGRGRNRGGNVRGRGAQVARGGKTRVRAAVKRMAPTTPSAGKTIAPAAKPTPAAKPAAATKPSTPAAKTVSTRGGLTLQQQQHLQQMQQLKSLPVVSLSSTSVQKHVLQSGQIKTLLRNLQPVASGPVAPPTKQAESVKDAEEETEKSSKQEAATPVKVEKARTRTISQSGATPQSPTTKGKKKPVAALKRTSTETVSPVKEEQTSPQTRRASVSSEESSGKKAPEITSPTEVTPEAQGRKMYPKRENRKPPAHLAEAFGPALFSTPDIPRRISDAKSADVKHEVKSEAEGKSDVAMLELPAELLVENPTGEAECDSKVVLVPELQDVLGEIGPELLEQMQEEALVMDIQEEEEEPPKSEPETSTPKGKATGANSKRNRTSSAKVKAQESAADQAKASGSGRDNKRGRGLSKVTAAAIRDIQAPSDEDEREEGEEDDAESWNSEDDPDRLWCICRKPHNNRFMICCDRCEEWFHGACVGITKSIGKQMESRGEEWTCPECAKIKLQEQQAEKAKVAAAKKEQTMATKTAANRRSSTNSAGAAESSQTAAQRRKSVSEEKGKSTPQQASKQQAKPAATVKSEDGVMCIVCRKAPARSASVYCSQECILKHAEEATSIIDKAAASKIADAKAAVPAVVASTSVASPKVATTIQQARVMLLERKTGKLLTGTNAPTLANLNVWLQKHPTYEVVTPGLLTTARAQGKEPGTIVLKTTPGSKQTTLKLVATPIKLPDTPGTPGAKTPSTPTSAKTTLLVPAQRLPTPATKTATQTPAKAAAAPKATPPSPTKAVAPKSAAKQGATTSKAAGSKAAAAAPATAPAPVEKVDKADEEPRIRISVRKTLKELLQSRVQECDDLKVSDNEVTGIASNIEEELHALFKDTGAKYKAKYRSLVFNIKDPKNLALFHKIVSGEVTPHRLVRLSPEELATKELAQWREREAQHTLDMIKKNEMELMAQSITYVMKTHKGEQLIETDDSLKLQALAVEAEPDALEAESAEGDTGFESSLASSEKLSSSATTEKTSKSSTASGGSSSSKKSHHHNSKSSSSRSSRHDKKHSKHSSSSSKHSSSSSRSKSHKSSKEKSSSRDTKDKERHHSQSGHRHSTDSHSSSSKSRKHSEHSEVNHSHTEKEKSSSRSSSSLSKSSGIHRRSSSIKDSSTPPQVQEAEPVKPVKTEKPPDPTPDLLATEAEPATPPTEDADLSDREPSSTVTIKTPDSNADDAAILPLWRGSFFGADIVKFAVTAHEVSGNVSGLQQELSGALEIVGRISPPIAWDYVSKMKKSGTKEIVVVRLNPATPEDKAGYLSYYSYLSNRVRFGVVSLKASAVKDYYVMPLSSHAPIPQILLPLDGPGFEESRPHLLLGIAVRTRRKRPAEVAGLPSAPVRSKEARQSATERSYTPPLPEPRERGTYTPPLPPKPPQEDLMPYSPGEPSSGTPSPPSDEASEQKTIYSSELEELNRQIEEEKQQIQQKMQTISSELVSTNSQDDLQVRSLLQQITQTQALLSTPIPGLTQLIVQTNVTEELTTAQVSTSQSVDDENEAYSPSRSFTPPPVTEESKFNLPDTSNISLPSNLQEILASIQRKGSSGTTVISESSSTTAVLSLETDPIVRDYASADEPVEATTPPLAEPDTSQDVDMRDIAPPVQERLRDPRKPPEPAKKSLSKLTEDELLAMAQAQEIAEVVPAVPIVPVVPTIPPPPLPPVMFYPPPTVPMSDVSPPGVMPVVLPPLETLPAAADWPGQSASKDTEPPKKGISFRVEKRQQQPRWCRNTDNKNSPKRSASSPTPDSPPRRKHHKDSSD